VTDEFPQFGQNGENSARRASAPCRNFADTIGIPGLQHEAQHLDPEQPSRCGSSPRDELQDSANGFTPSLAFLG